jgi:hypothetical protein
MKRTYVLSAVSSALLALLGFGSQAQAACSLAFTSPGDGASVTSAGITVFGQGGGDAVHGSFGTVTATLNGNTIFNYSGSFTAAVSFLQSAGVPVTLRPGLNYFGVSGSVGGCGASDAMTVMYDPAVDLGKNKGSGKDDVGCNSSEPSKTGGNPIVFSIGNKYQEEEDYRRASETFPLRFARSYNSVDGYWVHSYSTRLKIATGKTTLFFADGRQSPFAVSGVTVTPSATELGTLSQVSGGWRYVSSVNEIFDFDSTGRLTKWTNPYGLFHQLSYAVGGVVTVTDTYGNSLNFTQDTRYQPLTMAATAAGVGIVYNYDAPKRLQTVVTTTGTDVRTRTFHYENTSYPRFLTGITDERNVRYVTWEYDSLGRATKSVYAGGVDQTLVAHNVNGTTTVTNPLGKQTIYHYAVINGVKRITQIDGQPSPNCSASNSTYTYDSRGLVARRTDNKGNVTTYLYDSRGLETSRTEASGSAQQRVITTIWHTTLPLPTEVTMPDSVIAYTYDTQGRLLTKTITD